MNSDDFQSTIDYIEENIKITDLLDSYKLDYKKDNDDRLTMICPFHSEDTPSLKIYTNTNTFFCFGCGAGTGIINFIQSYENISLLEVLERYKKNGDAAKIQDTILKTHKKYDKSNFIEYYFSIKYDLGIILKKYLIKNKEKEDFVDSCFKDMDIFFEDITNLDKNKINYFSDTLMEKISKC